MNTIWDYALAILLSLGMLVGGLMALTAVWIIIGEWIFWYKQIQARRDSSTRSEI